MSLPSLPQTTLERLLLARRFAQAAADLARDAGARLERRDRQRFGELSNRIHDWSVRETAELTALLEIAQRLGV